MLLRAHLILFSCYNFHVFLSIFFDPFSFFQVAFGIIAVVHTARLRACLIRVCALTYTSVLACVCTRSVRACSTIISSTAPILFSSSLFCLAATAGSLEQELAGSLVTCCAEGKANSKMHKHRKRRFPRAWRLALPCVYHKAATWAASLTARAFFRLSVSLGHPVSFTVSYYQSSCAAAFDAWMLTNKDKTFIYTKH